MTKFPLCLSPILFIISTHKLVVSHKFLSIITLWAVFICSFSILRNSQLRQTWDSRWQLLKLGNEQIKTVQNKSDGWTEHHTTYSLVEIMTCKWKIKSKLGHVVQLTAVNGILKSLYWVQIYGFNLTCNINCQNDWIASVVHPCYCSAQIGAVETTSTTIPAYFLPSRRMPGKRDLFSQGIYKFTCNQEGLLRVTNFILCHSFIR